MLGERKRSNTRTKEREKDKDKKEIHDRVKMNKEVRNSLSYEN